MSRGLVVIRRRLIQAVPVVLIILTGNFLLLKLAPGDAVDAFVAAAGGADPGLIARMRTEYGLDQPLPVQLGIYLWKAVQFDLGHSFIYNRPVAGLLADRLVNTLLLMLPSLALAFGLGTLLGVAAARRAGRLGDSVIVTLGLVVYATPGFWIGLMMIVAFSVKLGWLPGSGLMTIPPVPAGWARSLDVARHLVMPVLALSLVYVAIYMRLMRAGMLEVYGLDFVRTARAKGLPERRVVWRHVVRNALLPMVTMLGLQFGALLGGSVVVESVFAVPGIGRLAYDSVVQRDLNTLLGIIYVSALLVILANLLVDLAYARLDPRIDRA